MAYIGNVFTPLFINATSFVSNTDALPEGNTNFYYSTTLANNDIDARVTKSYVDNLSIDAATLNGQNASYFLDYTNFTNVPNVNAIASGEASNAYANAIAYVNALSTDDLPEGSNNLYYTTTRANTDIDNRLQDLSVSIIPATNSTYDLGSATNRFNDLFLSGNTIYLGQSEISADGSIVVLPAGSRVGNSTIATDISELTDTTGLLLRDDLSNNLTDELAEGNTNLYYTEQRANSAIDARVTKAFVDNLNIDASTLDGFTAAGLGDYSDTVANNAYTNAVSVATNLSSNAYSNAIAHVASNYATTNNPIFTGVITAEDIYLNGDMTVAGNVVYLNTETLRVSDNIVELNSDVIGTPTQNAGILINRGTSNDVSIKWVESSDTWQYTTDGNTFVEIASNADISQVYLAIDQVYVNAVAYADSLTTSDVDEGTNQYFTVLRANTAIDNRVTKVFIDNLGVEASTLGGNTAGDLRQYADDVADVAYSNATSYTDLHIANTISYTDLHIANTVSYAETVADAAYSNAVLYADSLTTDNVDEGSLRLYYTVARANTAIDNRVTKVFIDNLGVEASTLGGNTAGDLRQYADDAASQSYSNAISYTDSITSITYTNATSYTDAEVAAAYSNATSYANTIAAAAYTNAISYTDAEITIAYSNATSYADSVATSKAAVAYSNATSYTDNVAATTYTNATSYADTKASDAFSNAVSNAATDASTKASTAYSNAVSDAASDATTKANAAYSNAIAYASDANNISSGTVDEARLPFRMDQDIQTTDSVEFSHLLITGDLTVTGNVTTISAQELTIVDNMIYMNANNTIANPDLGFAGNYNDGSYAHAGFFRDATDGIWKVYDGYLPEPDESPYIDTSNATFRIADFQANVITANSFSGNGANVSSVNAIAVGGNTALDLRNYSDTVATTAYSNATSYTDVEVSTAYTNATSYADAAAATAYTNATSYTDTVAATTYSNATSYADVVSDASYANATSYADTVAVTAYTNAVAYADSLTTDDISEANNLYYTTQRANTDIDARVTKTYIDALGVESATLGGNTAADLRLYAENEAITSYSNAVSDAATDASTKAATAYSNAVSDAASDATTKATTAYSNAVSDAATDATNKAATAYSNAVSDAASDATTKAATAYSNAVSDAATDASTKANAAYSNAVSYADLAAANAYSNAVAYADGIQSNNSNFWVYYADETALNAAYIHGAFAHVHATGAAYYGHAGNWVRLATQAEADAAYANAIAQDPSSLTDLNIVDGSNGQVLTTDGAGNFSFTTIAPGADLTAFSVSTANASGNGALSYDSNTGVFTFTPAEASLGGGGGANLDAFSVVTSSPSGNGALSYDANNGTFTFTPADATQGGSVGDGADVVGNTTTFDVTTTQNTFSVSLNTSTENVFVFLNGVKLKETTDYTLSSTGVTLNFNVANGDVVEVSRFASSYISPTVNVTSFAVTNSENTFNVDYNVGSEGVFVYLNGIKLGSTDDYIANTGNTIVLTANAESGDFLEVAVYDQGVAPSGVQLTDFSVNTVSSSGGGSLTYSGNGEFIFTPADLSTSANVSYVDSEVATVYSNATSYADAVAASEAATAYSNAVMFASDANNISSGTIAEARLPFRMNQNLETTDSVSFSGLTVSGDLIVTGNTVSVDSVHLEVQDPLIHLASNNETSDVVDIGFIGHYSPDGGTTKQHTGLFRDASDGVYKLFGEYVDPSLDSNGGASIIDIANSTFAYADLQIKDLIADNLSGNGASITSVDAATLGGNTAQSLNDYADSAAAAAYSNATSYADIAAASAYSNAISYANSAAAAIQSNTSNFWVYYADETALNSAYIHGAFAHVHGTGGAYFGHAGNWVRLATQNDAQGYADTAYANAIAVDPSTLTDLGISDGSNGQVLSTDGAGNFTFVDQTGGGADLTAFSVVTNAPSGNGSLTYDNSNGVFTFTPANATQGGFVSDGADVVGNTTTFDVTSAQNTFSVAIDTSTENVFVFLNGIKLKETADYTVSNTEVVLTTDAANGDVVEVSRFASSYISPTVNVTTFSVSSSENTFSVDYTVGSEGVQVYRNGIKLVASDDYTANTGNTIILAANAQSGDTVEVIVYDQGVAPSGVQLTDFSITTATASGGGSLTYDNAGGFTFTPADLSAATGGANVSYVDSEVVTAYANAIAYADTIAASEATTAYTNATSYADTIAASEAITAYSNAVSYADTIAASEAATAYSNATSFASNANNISSGTIAEARLPFRVDQDLQTTDSVSFSGLTVSGDLTVTGNTVSVDSVHLEVQDPLIHLASNNETSDVVDIGFIGHYSPDGGTTKQHTGLFRDASDGVYKLFGEYVDPSLDSNGGSSIIDIANNTFAYADLRVKDLTADNISANGANITSVDALTLGGNTAQSLNDYADSAAAAIQSNTSNFWVYYTDETALNAAYIHGAFAHVHGTGGAYYGHAGSWVRLASQSDAQGYADTSYSNAISYADTVAASEAATAYANAIAADPTTLTDLGISDGANGQVLTTDGAGNFSFTTVSGGGSGYTDADVDTHLNTSTASNSQVLSWNGADYAWVDQSSGSSVGTVAAETTSFNVTASQNTFSTTLNPSNQEIFVFFNGLKLEETVDYTTSTTGVTLNFDAANGDLVEVSTIQLSSGIGSGVAGNTTSFDVTSSQNTFSMNIDTSNETVFVHLNGIKLKATDDYTFNNGGVTLNFDAANGDVVEVSTFRSTTYISPTVNVTSFSVSGTQNTFSVGYTVGNEGVFVYQNGIKLIANTDYTADSGTDIVLTADAANGDIIEVLVYDQGEAPGTTITAGDNIVVSNTGSAFTISVSESPTFNVVSAVQFNNLSDLSLKDHVLTITGAPDMVSNMRGVSFVWKDTGLPSVGVIAQEVEQVVPEVVDVNENGDKTVNYSALVGVLIEAVKDLQKRVEYLENK